MSSFKSIRQSTLYRVSFILCLVASIGTLPASAATVEPGITLISENETIYLGDSVIIDVEAVGLLEPLDVSSLFQYADLLRETTGTRIAVFDGRVVEVKLRRMEFVPKKEGKVFFGPLTGESFRGVTTSNGLVIDVQPPTDISWEPDANDLQINLLLEVHNGPLNSLENKPVYVGQHITAILELKHRHPIFEEKLTLPTFEGFDVLAEFEARRTIEELDEDNSWRVITSRYHLFAQHSGKQAVSGIRWSGTAVRSRTQRSEFVRSTSNTTLNIIPATQSNEWWLPATAVSLSDEWSKDPKELSAGDEIIRTITLNAKEVLANQLPTITPLESRALSSTLIDQSRVQEITNGTIESSATFTYRMVAQSPIPVFLDTVRVPWFNTVDNTPKEAIIPARRINVGLPDRADLLAEIALQKNGWDRFTFTVSSHDLLKAPWHITLAVLLLICSIFGLREWVLSRREKKQYVGGLSAGDLPEL